MAESDVEGVAVAVINPLEDVLDVEPDALPDVLELDDDVPALPADDNPTVLVPLDEAAVLGEALVRT